MPREANSGQVSRFDDLARKRAAGRGSSLPDDPDSRDLLPLLWSFLTRTEALEEWEKETATISIRLGLGEWLVTLTDPTLQVSCTVAAPVLADALGTWEGIAGSANSVWTPWKGSEGKLKKKSNSGSTRPAGS
jgi:hypothetical protein